MGVLTNSYAGGGVFWTQCYFQLIWTFFMETIVNQYLIKGAHSVYVIYRTGYFYGAATNHFGLSLVLVGLSLGVNTSFKTKQGLLRTRKLR